MVSALIASCGDSLPSNVSAPQPDTSIAAALPTQPQPEFPDFGPIEPGASTACPAAETGPSDAKVAELINADFAKLDAEAKLQTLYVSLGHLTAGRSKCDLDFFRFGVGQLMNMTSWADDIVPTKFIDQDDMVARFDVRDLKWTPETLAYVMTISDRHDYGDVPGVKSGAVAVRADWLASNLTRPPAYTYVVRNELHERLIESQAGVALDAKRTFGGVYTSIVALNPRFLERRESKYGACWIGHDFLYRTQAIAAMETGVLPPDDLRFGLQTYIAREYICSLPNGMQSYDLTGFISQRRWDVPTCVAQNKARDDKLVLNGQCFNCHSDGLIPFKDKVRGDNPNPSDYIKERFPEQREMDALVAKDQARYKAALAKIPYYDASYLTPLNEMIAVYAKRAKADLREVSGGTFGAFLPKGGSVGPLWENVVNPIADLAVDVGILLPAGFLLQDIPETVIPAFEEKYRAAGIDEDATCFSF
jgi:hypothetical protein